MTAGASASEARTAPRVGALVRRLTIRVVNISPVGCLLESTVPVEEGTVALLALHIGGRRFVDPVRITRVARLPGGIWAYRLGADLLNLTPPSGTTLRRVALLEGAELAIAEARTTSDAEEKRRQGTATTGAGDAGTEATTSDRVRTTLPRAGARDEQPGAMRQRCCGRGPAPSAAASRCAGNKGDRHMQLFNRFVRDEQGQDLIEYALLGSFVALVVLVGATTLGTRLNAWYTNVATWVGTQANAVPGA